MCNTPEDWINTLNFLINNKIQKFNRELFDLFVQKFSYEAVREQLKKYLINWGIEMKVLVTGAGGMVGSHMVELLHSQGHDVLGTYYKPTTDIT